MDNINDEIYTLNIINYTIIREIWKLVYGAKNMGEFYIFIDITPNRYAKLVGGYNTRMTNEAKRLSEATGVDAKYFLGEVSFKLKELGYNEWKSYGSNKDTYNEIYQKNKAGDKRENTTEIKSAKRAIRKFERALRENLATLEKEDMSVIKEYEELYRIYYWFRYKERFGLLVDKELENLIMVLERVEINKLERLDEVKLDLYIKYLREQLEKASAVKVYRKYVDGEPKGINKQIYKLEQAIGKDTKI